MSYQSVEKIKTTAKLLKTDNQDYGKAPTEVRETQKYQEEYINNFVEKWDELIDWEARSKGEGDFFIRELKKRNKHKVLDVAAGTGYHSVQLMKEGFDVWTADGSPNMLAKAFENGKQHGFILRTIQADWRWLNKTISGRYDAVINLGNSFTHLFSEKDRRKSLAEYYSALKHDGVLIIDQRNYDAILDNGFSTKHTYYYAGNNVKAEPEFVDDGLTRFRYEFPDGSAYHLNMCPIRKNYLIRLLKEVGFQKIETYADFQESKEQNEPDFFIHIAHKEYSEED